MVTVITDNEDSGQPEISPEQVEKIADAVADKVSDEVEETVEETTDDNDEGAIVAVTLQDILARVAGIEGAIAGMDERIGYVESVANNANEIATETAAEIAEVEDTADAVEEFAEEALAEDAEREPDEIPTKAHWWTRPLSEWRS